MALRFRFVLLLGNYVTEEQLTKQLFESDIYDRGINVIPDPEMIENNEWHDI